MGAQCSKTVLQADTVLLSVCGKYKDFCSQQSRTLIIGPIPEQKLAYEFLVKCEDHLISQLKPGTKISEAYKSVHDFASKQGEQAGLAKFLPKTLGYGIGLQPKEELLAIKADNHKVIEVGNMFTVRLSLANFDRENRPTRNCLQIADTVLVTADGCEVMTKGNSRDFNDISYTIDEDEEVEERGESAALRRSNNP